ncbi:MAG: hypothetical protein ACUZ8H_10725 [Candidatus Anammoxibacter sp.]
MRKLVMFFVVMFCCVLIVQNSSNGSSLDCSKFSSSSGSAGPTLGGPLAGPTPGGPLVGFSSSAASTEEGCAEMLIDGFISSSISPIGRVADLTFSNMMNGIVVHSDKSVGPVLYYENVNFDISGADLDGDIIGGVLSGKYEKWDTTFQVTIPYSHTDFGNAILSDIDQVGVILGARHRIPLFDDKYVLGLSGNINYFNTYYDFTASPGDETSIDSWGTGFGVTFSYKGKKFIPTFGISYNVITDETNASDIQIVKPGVHISYLATDKLTINTYGRLNWRDMTDLDGNGTDENDFDIGVEVSYTVSDMFNFEIGYKKVIDNNDFESDKFYLGTVIAF